MSAATLRPTPCPSSSRARLRKTWSATRDSGARMPAVVESCRMNTVVWRPMPSIKGRASMTLDWPGRRAQARRNNLHGTGYWHWLPAQVPLRQSLSSSQGSVGLPARQIEPPTQKPSTHWPSLSQRRPGEPSEHTYPVGDGIVPALMQMLLSQSLASSHSASVMPLVHKPALLPPVAQRLVSQSTPVAHQLPSRPSVHSPRPRPTLYAHAPSAQSSVTLHGCPSWPVVHTPPCEP